VETFLLVWVDAYYFLWAYTLKYSLPKSTSEMLIKAMRGNIEQAKDYLLKELTKNVEEAKNEEVKVEVE
jgi:hypothetical protein